LELCPLTLLFGRQGTGKSSILEALWRFSNVLTFPQPTLEMMKEVHPNIEYKEMVHKGEKNRKLTIEIQIPYGDEQSAGWKVEFWFDKEKRFASQELTIQQNTIVKVSRPKIVFEIPTELKGISPFQDPLYLIPEVFLIPEDGLKVLKVHEREKIKKAYTTVQIIRNSLIGKEVSKVAILSPLRGEVPISGDVNKRVLHENGELEPVGYRGENLIELLAISKKPIFQNWFSSIQKWSEKLGLSQLVSYWSGTGPTISSEYQDKVLKCFLKLHSASYGAKQALCMIVQLFSPFQRIILIEEPESSLHPEAVSLLPQMIYEAIKQGKQIIATTHSTILPLAISKLIKLAKKDGICIRPNELISIYEIKKDNKFGTIAEKREVDERGYIKGYIPSFYEVELQLLREWQEGLPKYEAQFRG